MDLHPEVDAVPGSLARGRDHGDGVVDDLGRGPLLEAGKEGTEPQGGVARGDRPPRRLSDLLEGGPANPPEHRDPVAALALRVAGRPAAPPPSRGCPRGRCRWR